MAADFSKELTTAVLWLNEHDLDIRCVRLKPYLLNGEVVVDAQQIVPLPKAQAYQVGIRKKASSRREAVRQGGEPTGYWFMNVGDDGGRNENRTWEDCRKYGFMTAGGGKTWIDAVRRLQPGAKVFAYSNGAGYVGLGEVLAAAVPQKDFIPPGKAERLIDLPTRAKSSPHVDDPERCDWFVAVRWLSSVDRDQGVLKDRWRRGTVEQIRKPDLVADLLKYFDPPDGA